MNGIEYFSVVKNQLSNSSMLKSNSLKYTFCLIICLYTITVCNAQHEVSKYEKRWAIFHPFVTFKIKRALPKAMLVYKEVKLAHLLDTLEYGGKLDAFRHTYVMAFLAQRICIKKLRKLGMLHEKGNKLQFEKREQEYGDRADSSGCEMDLRNNEVGFIIGSGNKKSDQQALKEKVIAEIKSGNAWYLKRNSMCEWVDCSGHVINLAAYTHTWFIPKCLVKTNE